MNMKTQTAQICLLLSAVTAVACSSADETDNGATSSTSTTTTTSTSTASGAGGSGGQGGSAGGGAGEQYVPTPQDVGFKPLAPVPQGEQILFNDWSFPDVVRSMAPDGSNAVDVFQIYRVWSMGVSRQSDRLAFACGDPKQEEHYGLTLGDAIQHSWIYDFATESAQVLAYGNINDECHHFAPNDEAVHVCRRYDFTSEPSFEGYRLARISLPDGEASFSLPLGDNELQLNPQLTADGGALWYARILVENGKQNRAIMKQSLPDGTPAVVRHNAYRVLFSPDGTRYLYADTTKKSALHSSGLDGSDEKLVVDRAGSSPQWSPDGSKIAYLLWDNSKACSHVEVVASDGSQSDNPTRIRDCGQTGEMITDLAWFVRQ